MSDKLNSFKHLKDKYLEIKDELQEKNIQIRNQLDNLSAQFLDNNLQIQQQIFYHLNTVPLKKHDNEQGNIEPEVVPIKKNKNDVEENQEKKTPIYITTWEDTQTGQLMAYSIGIGSMGTTVHDVSHLNLTRDEFMREAVTIVNGSAPNNLEELFKEKFPSTKTYESFDEYRNSYRSTLPNPFKKTPFE